MVTERHRVAASCRIAVSLLALGLFGPSGASPAAVDRQEASSVSSAESITPGDIAVGPDGNHFYVRQLWDGKIKPVVEIYDEDWMLEYADACGQVLARAHANSADPAMISGYLGGTGRFDRAVADFAVAYADQNEADHAAFLKAIRNGKIEVYQER